MVRRGGVRVRWGVMVRRVEGQEGGGEVTIRVKLSYRYFVGCLDVEHEVLNHIHLILGVHDVETCTAQHRWNTHTPQKN